MNRAVRIGLCACLTAAVSAGAAEPRSTPAKPATTVRVDFTDTTLPNGLRVQLVEDHAAPVIALNIAYDVGSRNERRGRTGFAHLFEHMMFKGSSNVGDGEHFYQVFSNGGSMNGTTGNDLTLYFETLPANQLELRRRSSTTSGRRCRRSGGCASTTSLTEQPTSTSTSCSMPTSPTSIRPSARWMT
jgi:zinc protease